MENSNKKIKKFESNKQMKKKRNTKIKIIIFFVMLVTVCILLFTLPIFKISSIEVVGNSYYSSDNIITSSKIENGSNMFGQAIFTGCKYIYELPYISKAKLNIKLPNKLIIKIEERKSVFYAYDSENKIYYRLDKDGYILETADKRNEEEVILNGITFDSEVEPGKKINDVDMQKLEIYNKIYEEFKSSKISGNITKVSFESSLTTITINDKLSVIFPNLTNLKYNVAILKGIIKNIGEDSSGIIDLNKENPTFSNF